MEKIIKQIDRLSSLSAFVSGFLICCAIALIISEIFLRTFFSTTLYISDEYTGYFMAILTLLSFGYTLKEKGHIRMSLVRSALSDRKRDMLDIWCLFVALVFGLLLTYGTFIFFLDSVAMRTQAMSISETYLAIPQFFLPLGALVFTLQTFSELYKSSHRLRNFTTKEKKQVN